MTASIATQRLQGIAVLAALGAIGGLLAWSALGPVLELRQSIADVNDRVEKFKLAAASASIKNIDASMVISTGGTVEARSLAIQRGLVDDTAAVGVQMRQLSAIQRRDLERGLVRLSYEMDVAGDLEHWTSFLKLLADRRPALFVDKVVLRAGPGAKGDLNLSMQMTLSAYVLKPATSQ